MPKPVEQYPRAPYNTFRRPGSRYDESGLLRIQEGKIDKIYDEPTYLTFRLRFDYSNIDIQSTNFDQFPMPLFHKYEEDDYRARNFYSTYQYLRDSNEMVRADMLWDWIDKFNTLQMNYQWYFKGISGLDSILTANPARGIRVSPEEGRITVSALEGLDLRITHLLDTYRKIAWDDVYQRWILPDMMRYFSMSIYITEFRSFHRSNISSRIDPGTGSNKPMILELIESFTPVYVLDLERCEFDITSIKKSPDSLTIEDAEMREVEFDIKVGNLKERYINPMLNYFYYDWMINGFGRSQRYNFTSTGSERTIVPGENDLVWDDQPKYNLSSSIDSKANPLISSYSKGDALADPEHESGRPFIQTGYLDNIKNSSPNYNIDAGIVVPTDPTTWIGNALTLGRSFVENLVESKVDELKVSKIPGLGVSFNEAIAAIQSKNVFTLFGAARRAIQESVSETLPSQELDANFIDTQFKEFLVGVSESEATDEDALELQKAANTILNDQGVWEEIKDLSKATNLISNALGEVNTLAEIENPNALKTQYLQSPYEPQEVKDGLVYEGIPSSTATGEPELEGQKISQPLPGEAVNEDGVEQIESYQSTELGSTDGQLGSGSTIAPSEQLGESAGESGSRPEDGLGSKATGGLSTAEASEQLGESAGESGSRPEDGLGKTAEDGYDTVKPSEKLGSRTEGKGIDIPNPGEATDGDDIEAGALRGDPRRLTQIERNKIDLPEPGEAVDDDPLEAKSLPQPPPSRATNNDLG